MAGRCETRKLLIKNKIKEIKDKAKEKQIIGVQSYARAVSGPPGPRPDEQGAPLPQQGEVNMDTMTTVITSAMIYAQLMCSVQQGSFEKYVNEIYAANGLPQIRLPSRIPTDRLFRDVHRVEINLNHPVVLQQVDPEGGGAEGGAFEQSPELLPGLPLRLPGVPPPAPPPSPRVRGEGGAVFGVDVVVEEGLRGVREEDTRKRLRTSPADPVDQQPRKVRDQRAGGEVDLQVELPPGPSVRQKQRQVELDRIEQNVRPSQVKETQGGRTLIEELDFKIYGPVGLELRQNISTEELRKMVLSQDRNRQPVVKYIFYNPSYTDREVRRMVEEKRIDLSLAPMIFVDKPKYDSIRQGIRAHRHRVGSQGGKQGQQRQQQQQSQQSQQEQQQPPMRS